MKNVPLCQCPETDASLVGVTRTFERRLLAALLGAVIVAVALLGTVSPAMAESSDWCPHGPCDHEVPPADDHDFPQHDPCLHDHACGGGGALQHGGALVALPAEHAPTLAAQSVAAGSHPPPTWMPNAALIVGGIERPPRAA